jgi:hypothetical protein
VDESEQLALGLEAPQRSEQAAKREAIRDDTKKLTDKAQTKGEPLVKVLAVLVGANQ